MIRRSIHSLLASLAGLALAALACGGSAPSIITSSETSPLGTVPSSTNIPPTPSTPAVDPPTISNSFGYTDESGYYHVVGLLHNGTSQVLTNINLTLTVTDENGQNLLKSDLGGTIPNLVFHPMLDTLAPGEDSPFDSLKIGPTLQYRPTEEPVKHAYKLSVTGYQAMQAAPAKLAVQGLKIEDDTASKFKTLLFDIVNEGSQAVLLNGEASALLDSQGNVVSAYGGPYKYLLAPAGDPQGYDRIPSEMDLFYSQASTSDTHPQIYLDAVQYPNYRVPNVSFQVTKTYYDYQHEYHILGTLTNNEQTTRMPQVLANLYPRDGSWLAVSSTSHDMALASGESIPVDLTAFAGYRYDPNSSTFDHYSIYNDPLAALDSPAEFVPLQTAGDAQNDNGNGELLIEGSVTNASNKTLSYFNVVVGVYDSHNKPVGVGWDYEGVGEYTAIENFQRVKHFGDIPAGGTVLYSTDILLDPALEGGKFTLKTWAQGFPP